MRCAVLGDPIAHSLSPVLHRAAYDRLGLADWSYDAVRVSAGSLGAFLAGLSGEWRGLSLTMPLKREAMGLLASVSHRGRLVGAVNTMVRTSYGWAGDNTDLPGAVAAVRERYDGAVRSAAVLGGGATAASTGLALAELGAGRITVLARDPGRAAETVDTIRRHPSRPKVAVRPLEAAPDADVLVSTIPARAQTAELVARWRGVPVLFDVVYDPWPTPLVAAAGEEPGTTVVSGLDLLVHQAMAQVELFTGVPAPLEAMRAAAAQALGLATLAADPRA
jgi:shikimate dehydrogenase